LLTPPFARVLVFKTIDATLLFATVCACAVGLAALTLRIARARTVPAPLGVLAWLLLAAGLGGLALLAFAEFTGRLGPEHFWFRTPSFYVAAVILLGAAVWWLRRPAPALLRVGLPALLLVLGSSAALIGRLDGRSRPLTLAMPTLGTKAPALTYFDPAGQQRNLAELDDRVVLLNFWATWCVPCRREMPLLSKMQRKHAADGLVVLYVSLEEPEVLARFLASNQFDGVQARLDRADAYYEAGRIYPLSYLISRDGRVAYRWSGRPREEWLEARVRELLD
jgi:thiol-disulfide isomerase/thioredoxin